MTKIEEKLIELGYEQNRYISSMYTKNSRAVSNVTIVININQYGICDKSLSIGSNIRREMEIDLLYASFKEMQKDLEILKGAEDEKNK